jgi:hypothetical protein
LRVIVEPLKPSLERIAAQTVDVLSNLDHNAMVSQKILLLGIMGGMELHWSKR